MANEAVLVQQLEDRLLEVTIADTAFEKGTVLKLSDPNTGAASSADGDIFLGILATEKVSGDGQTRVAVWRHGVFDMKNVTGETITAGAPVKISGANLITIADDDTVENAGQVIGIALQSATSGEVIEVLVGAVA